MARPASDARLMAVCNVTPNSFSGDGLLQNAANGHHLVGQLVDQLSAEFRRLVDEGAQVIDIGAESTAPGSVEVSLEEELRRLESALRAVQSCGLPCEFSVDTVNATTAQAALEHGFTVVNDVSGGRRDSRMFSLIAANPRAKYVMMYCKNVTGRADTK
eukprot:gene4757-7315_t